MKGWSFLTTKTLFSMVIFLMVQSLPIPALAAPVTPQAAKRVAENWLSEQTGNQQSAVRENLRVGALQESLSTADGGDAYYVYSMPSGGWAIVSGDDVAYPIIGYSESGTLDPNDIPPAFADWMDMVGAEIRHAAADPQTRESYQREAAQAGSIAKQNSDAWNHLDRVDFEPAGRRENRSARTSVGPLLRTSWAQGQYYNASCPTDKAGPDGHALVGCCAIAMAQILRYHESPTSGTGSHAYNHPKYGRQYADFGASTYALSSMPYVLDSSDRSVAEFLYHVGVSLDMHYGPDSSGCSQEAIAPALRDYFGYEANDYLDRKNYPSRTWVSMMKQEIDASRPVLYMGMGKTGGHAFVLDGYKSSNGMFHFNWGWGGHEDNYFSLNRLTPGDQNYTPTQYAVVGIKPGASEAASPNQPGTYPDQGNDSYEKVEDFSGGYTPLNESDW